MQNNITAIVHQHDDEIISPKNEYGDLEKEILRQNILESHESFVSAVREGNKDFLRELHIVSSSFVSQNKYDEVFSLYKKYSRKFIDGKLLDPSKIKPSLKFVTRGSCWDDLFKITRHTWSIPYTKGYGRRMRFVVYDEYHEAVIGILGFQSPPADLACRDVLFDYPADQKMNFINRTMDVFTIGSVPPYSNILGGKLVAGLVSSDDIRKAYWKLYAGKKTLMQDQLIEQPLVAVTTTSVYGRSSIYNKLKYEDRLLAEPIGYTSGFGTIHLEKHYPEIRKLLNSDDGVFTSGGYGAGPKIKWQNFSRAFAKLELPASVLKHSLNRQVFMFRYVSDLEKGMAGNGFGTHLNLTVEDYAAFWKSRWCIPRSERISDWKGFSSDEYFTSIFKKNTS